MEHLVPLHRESWSFFERQRQVFEDMFKDQGDEFKEFDMELERIRKEMFTLKSDFGSSSMIQPERPIVEDSDGNKRLSLRFDCKEFKPEEITVKTIDNKLMVQAKHVEESPGRKVPELKEKPEEIVQVTLSSFGIDPFIKHKAPSTSVYREFSKQYILPQKIDPLTLDSTLASDGVLSIEAPAPAAIAAPRERILPIKRL